MDRRKRYAIVGTGARAGMFVEALTITYRDVAELVAFCDLSQTRMEWYNHKLAETAGLPARPTYHAEHFEQMIAETKPDTIIVATMDSTHHLYITRAMELGCDVITEKPMTTDLEKLRAIYDAIERTGRSLRVTFNYRYAPAYTQFRKLVMDGAVGRPLAVDFSWLLDTSHGADYFRRWHRQKENSGGLLVHKATHHFDLVNWWIDAYPQSVFALGSLSFYGRDNAEARGEQYAYERYTGVPEAQNDPFALFLTSKEALKGLYLEAEAETGYLRDRNVFGEPITIEDTLAVTARYSNGALLSYCLVAYSPWEGLRVAITGSKGRIEMDIEESVTHLLGDGQAADVQASKGPFKQARMRVFPTFGQGYEVEVSAGAGGHGGADPIMLEQIFSPNPPPDPFDRAASHVDGAASILVGIAGNQSMESGRLVHIDDLFPLSSLRKLPTSGKVGNFSLPEAAASLQPRHRRKLPTSGKVGNFSLPEAAASLQPRHRRKLPTSGKVGNFSLPEAPTHLRVNDVVNPAGTPGRPYFGWLVSDSRPNQEQTCYQLLVASGRACLDADTGDVWNSGKVVSSRQNHVAYDGELSLSSNRLYWWKVRTWDRDGYSSPYSEPGTFTTGLLANEAWAGAVWIRRESSETDDVTYYRKTVSLPEGHIERATLFITAVHKYELFINGHPVGRGPSYHYPQYQYYNAYDVTAHLAADATNLFAVLTHWFGAGQGRPASARGLLLKAVVEYAGGRHVIIGSDQSWQQRRAAGYVSDQPQRNDEGVGVVEKIDARQLIPDWYMPSYQGDDWQPAVAIGPQPTPPWTGRLYPDLSRIVERSVTPAAINDKGGGRYVVDLGKVYAGRPQITFSGGAPGTVIAMEGGYTLTAAGTIDPAHNQNTDMRYLAIANGGEFNFLPQEYLGMRYFQVDNAPMPITGENFRFISRHAMLDESRSAFTSSHPTLNQVWEVMKDSLTLGTQEQFLDTPTREKGGFLVDSMNESLAAMAVFGERVLTRKTLQEFLHSMGHYWSSAGDRGRMNAVYPNGDGARDIPDFTQAYLVWLWEYYMHSGDKEFLVENYAQLKSIADYVHRHQDSVTGLIHRLTGGSGPYQYGIVDWPPSMRYGYDMTAVARTVINAYAYADYDVIGRIAAEVGETADEEQYYVRAEAIKDAINRHLLNEQGVYVDGLKADGAQSVHVSQQANTLPLALGIVPPDRRATILERIKAMKMRSGMVTVYWLIRALGEMDAGEHLIDLYTQATWDGWAKNVAQGATSTWESWDADSGGGLSLSHPWGAVGLAGMQQYILGVKPLAPQYEWIQIKPLSFGTKLASAAGKVPSDRGDIMISWEHRDGRFAMRVTLPANVRARVCVPAGGGPGTAVLVDGAAARGRADGRYLVLEDVGSGTHTFERKD